MKMINNIRLSLGLRQMFTQIKNLFLLLFVCFSLSSLSAETVSREKLEYAFSNTKAGMLDALVELLKPSAKELSKKFQPFGYCVENAQNKNWLQWRESNNSCGATRSKPDDFRRFVVREIEETVGKIMLDSQMIPRVTKEDKEAKISSESLRWIAIGTPGPKSDIDTVGILDDEIFLGVDRGKYLPKLVAEIRAKTLFDALGIATFNEPLSVAFDTESYIDVTDDLHKNEYEKRIKDPSYQNLAITLAFVQIARQLYQQIKISGEPVYDVTLFKKQFVGSKFLPLFEDAKNFSEATFPKSDPAENIRTYIPIINHLVLEASKTTDEVLRSKIKGMLGTYFPEAYYTREALAHVCYSDDDFSQLMLTLIAEYFKNGLVDEVPIEKINEFKSKTITPDAFIFAVSAVENLGYFFHKLDKQNDVFDGLKNAAKYFFRVSRAFAGYWKVPNLDVEIVASDSAEQRYVRELYFISERLERLKRGYIPFASPAEAGSVLREVDAFLGRNTKKEQIQDWANTLYSLHTNRYLSSAKKRDGVSKIARNFERAISYDNGTYSLTQAAAKNEPSAELIALFELVSTVDSDSQNTKLIRQKIENQLHAAKLPRFTQGAIAIPIAEIKPAEVTAFLEDMVAFTKHTLENYSKTRGFEPKVTSLTKQADGLIGGFLNRIKNVE